MVGLSVVTVVDRRVAKWDVKWAVLKVARLA